MNASFNNEVASIDNPMDDSGYTDNLNEFKQGLQYLKANDIQVKQHDAIVSYGKPAFSEYLVVEDSASLNGHIITNFLVLPACLLGSDEPVNYCCIMPDKQPVYVYGNHWNYSQRGFISFNLPADQIPNHVYLVHEIEAAFKLSACKLPCVLIPPVTGNRQPIPVSKKALQNLYKSVINALEAQHVQVYIPAPLHEVSTFKTLLRANKARVLAIQEPISQNISSSVLAEELLELKTLVDKQCNTKNKTSLRIVNMNDIEAQPINWLWTGWLPLGKITILAGAGGCGKTNLVLSLIATISNGGIFPDGSKCSNTGRVLIYSTEDDASDTLKPRLMANGADLSNIDFIAGRLNEKGERETFDASKDLPLLYAYAEQHPDIKLLMIDPVISAVGGDSNKATDVRRSLQVLVDFASDFNCSVIGITHFSKGAMSINPADNIIGSQAFTALARMVWVAAKRESMEDCVLVRAKSNISTLEGGVLYQIESDIVADNIETTRTAWLGLVEGNVRELLHSTPPDDSESALDEAKSFILKLLSEVTSLPSKDVKQQCKQAGLSLRTLDRASTELKVTKFRPEGETVWHWKLADSRHDMPQVLPKHRQRAYI